jgi:hypothetical protein
VVISIFNIIKKNWPICILLFFPPLLFHHHVLGDATWIGNPDRISNFLKVLQYYVENQIQGQTNAWNDFELMGYDAYALPFIYPSILTFFTGYISQLLGVQYLYIIAGYLSIFLLSLCGITAYLLINTLTRDKTVSFIGASCYQLSALAILNMSQLDNTLSVLIVMPLIIFYIRNATKKNLSVTFIMLTLLIFSMINFMFLQTVSYVFIFSGIYLLYRSKKTTNKYLILVFTASVLIAIFSSFPRLYTLFTQFQEYERSLPAEYGIDLSTFKSIYEIHTKPMEILRWFDNVIFGHSPSESSKLNDINISEGILLYSSSIIPFLIIYITVYYKGKFFGLLKEHQLDAAFFFWSLALVLSIIFIKPILYLFYMLYFKVSFFHTRILLVGLLTISILTSYGLLDLRDRHIRAEDASKLHLLSFILVVFFIGITEFLSRQNIGFITLNGMNLLNESITRIGFSATVFFVLLFFISSKNSNLKIKYFSFSFLCFFIVLQAFFISYTQINHSKNFKPGTDFKFGDFYYADRDKFLLPQKNLTQLMHDSLENDLYRTALICDPDSVYPLCAGHVGEFWHLRLVDGYYGLGLPKRLSILPWQNNRALRAVRFLDPAYLPWELLGLLGVKYVIKISPELYENIPFEKGNSFSVFKDMKYIVNPYPVLPRAFFARSTKPVKNSQEALHYIFQDNALQNVRVSSAVEGNLPETEYSTRGHISISGKGDNLEIKVDPSDKKRFLVLNDLYFPGWIAKAAGKELVIYPTNVFARGIIIPPFVDTVTFHYQTWANSPNAWYFLAAGFFLLVIGATILNIHSKKINQECHENKP